MNRLSTANLEALYASLKPTHEQYDPAECMLRQPFSSPGYHTTLTGGQVHPTRESLGYSVLLLDTGKEDLRVRAEGILRKVIALQDTDPASKTYGIWPWFLEEPLSRMSPPDWNWADFCSVRLLQVAIDHRERITRDLMAGIDTAIQHAARSIQRRNVGPDYTNIAVMGTYVTLLAGSLYKQGDLLEYGKARLRRIYDCTKAQGSFAEYNSPTYTVVTLNELGRLRQHVNDTALQPLIEELYRMAWQEIAEHFHVPTRQWAGPHSRAYRTLAESSLLDLIERGTEGHVVFSGHAPRPAYHRLALPCPRDLESCFRDPARQAWIAKTYGKGEVPVIGRTYLTPAFALGSISRSDMWAQRRSLVAYWGNYQNPSYLHVRFLTDVYYDLCTAQLYAVQHHGRVLAAIVLATDGGGRHPSLDPLENGTLRARDLRMRIELGGAIARVQTPALPHEMESPIRIKAGPVRIDIRVPYADFGPRSPYWEMSSEEGKKGYDLVLHTGEEKTFSLRDMSQAVIGLAIQFSISDAPPVPMSARYADGRLAMQWAGLELTVPTRPDEWRKLHRVVKAVYQG